MPNNNQEYKERLLCIKSHLSKGTQPTPHITSSLETLLNQNLLDQDLLDQDLLDQDLAKPILLSSHLSCDSRDLKKDSSFIAIKGEHHDGHDFIDELLNEFIEEECVIFAEHYDNPLPPHHKAIIILVKDTQAFANEYASIFYHHPSKEMKIIGITGTNGKTTSTYYLESFYRHLNLSTGVIGTIGIRYGETLSPNPNTTPEPVLLQRTLSNMKKEGVEVVIMEISSHALSLGRVMGLQLDSVLLTNVTQDHLDFHGDMEGYLQAKLKIFDLLIQSTKQKKQAIIWGHIQYGERVLDYIKEKDIENNIDISTYYLNYLNDDVTNKDGTDITSVTDLTKAPSLKSEASFVLMGDIKQLLLGAISVEMSVTKDNNTISSLLNTIPIIGEYNLLNLMGCLCELIASHYLKPQELNPFITRLNQISVPGRVESIENNKGALVVVDYAHTPDALNNVIHSLKKLPHAKLITLFGCGGDRDESKRPMMGRVAGEGCDFVYITSDNPRTEEPKNILDMIVPAVIKTKTPYKVIEDRQTAIKEATKHVGKRDILLIAGKGHEDYQIIGSKKIAFDDRDIARTYLSNDSL